MISNYIEKLSIINYKNIDEKEFIFDHKINCFVGKNGVGKTNILDSIFHLCIGKSYFKSKSEQMNILFEAIIETALVFHVEARAAASPRRS